MGGYSIGWGENIRKYLNSFNGLISMSEAGKQKQDNYDIIYSGGSLFALILDIEMNFVSNGKVGVPDLLFELNKKFGGKDGGQYVLQDLKSTTNLLCSNNLDYLFDFYVLGKEVIPIAMFLEKAGLQISNPGKENQKIITEETLTNSQKAVLNGILNKQ